ncbi:MAG: DUF2752 domain-containing protein [Treponema sp.]|jgi:hypothetical protein|nr:DUF2752 domain-containing protein [Treponema sp.]
MPLLNKIRALKNKNTVLKFLIVLAVLSVFYSIPRKYFGEKFPICIYRILFKQNCFGCGTTRAIWSILHLKIKDAIEYNKLIIISFPLLVGCTISWINKDKKCVK